jgi:group II intron reverse transcriptase/maturase
LKVETLLDRALDMDNLRLAWNEIADNEGIPGVDEVSIRIWRRNWEERLVGLAQAVRTNTYRPKRLRLRRIPKRDRRAWRTLRIPTVSDRVLQRAVLQVLYPIFESRFLDCSFGYRPGRSLQDAVDRILVLRENGYRWLLDADIDNFFDNLDHELLMQCLEADLSDMPDGISGLPDSSLFRLFELWLMNGRVQPQKAAGLPMGSPLSPLLANVFLHRLDRALSEAGYPLVRYADDFLVFGTSQEEVETIYQVVESALEVMKLRYEPGKTRLASFEQGFEFLGVLFEGDTYQYRWEDKTIEVRGKKADWLFSRYGPDYE